MIGQRPSNSWGYDSPGIAGGLQWYDGIVGEITLTAEFPYLFNSWRQVPATVQVGDAVTDTWSEPVVVGHFGRDGAQAKRGRRDYWVQVADSVSGWPDGNSTLDKVADDTTEGANVIADVVSIYHSENDLNNAFVKSKTWNGNAWVNIHHRVDGNALFPGTVIADQIRAGGLQVTDADIKGTISAAHISGDVINAKVLWTGTKSITTTGAAYTITLDNGASVNNWTNLLFFGRMRSGGIQGMFGATVDIIKTSKTGPRVGFAGGGDGISSVTRFWLWKNSAGTSLSFQLDRGTLGRIWGGWDMWTVVGLRTPTLGASITDSGTVTDPPEVVITQPPNRPNAPSVIVSDSKELVISWSEPATSEGTVDSYQVRYRKKPSVSYTTVTRVSRAYTTGVLGNGSYGVQVRASNDLWSSWSSETSATISDPVIPSVVVVAPTSDAGVDQTVKGNEVVRLDGSGSDDGGGSLTYQWFILGITPVQDTDGIASPNITLSSYTSVSPTFTAPVVKVQTVYRLSLRVRNSKTYDDDPMTVTVQVATVPKVATKPGTPATITSTTSTYTTLTISWTAAGTGDAADEYEIRWRNVSASTYSSGDKATVTSGLRYIIRGLTNSTSYVVQVRGKNTIGTSAWKAAGFNTKADEYSSSSAC